MLFDCHVHSWGNETVDEVINFMDKGILRELGYESEVIEKMQTGMLSVS